MPVRPSPQRGAAAFVAYVCVAVVFAWPIPLNFRSAVLGPVDGDAGVYIWNLWVFRHELLSHHAVPFLTREILSLTSSVPLALHNYTTVANILAFPLLPWLGTVATYNVLALTASATSAFAMFFLARHAVRDDVAAWVAGLTFGFAPFMNARATEHVSLLQAAPLPIFLFAFETWQRKPSWKAATALGGVVAWAFLSDPYYAVYCQLIAVFVLAYASLAVQSSPAARAPRATRLGLDLALVCLSGLIVGILLRGGGRFDLFHVHVSLMRLYTPVLLLTLAVLARVWVAIHSRITWASPHAKPLVGMVVVAGGACLAFLSPVLLADHSEWAEPGWIMPAVFWRSSAPGTDLVAFLLPNPLHPWFGDWFHGVIARMPNGFVENVASVPLTLIGVVACGATVARARLPRFWVAFTAAFGLLALGPFVRIAGVETYVPTPWALLRYVPLVGAARMPTRVTILVMLGASMLLAHALRDLRQRGRHPTAMTVFIVGLLIFELLPAPRRTYSAAVPAVFQIIASDPRPVRVLNLPFGLRDGMSQHGRTTAAWQYYQTVHEKPLLGAYMSRLPHRGVDLYEHQLVTRVLMQLSVGVPVPADQIAAASAQARALRDDLKVGYVVVDVAHAPSELVRFARESFDLALVTSDGHFVLYRSPLASP